MNESLRVAVLTHDWESVEVRDLMERIEIVDVLREMPQNELAVILKLLTPEKAAKAVRLIEIRTIGVKMKRKGKALYRIELHGKIMPFGRFYSWMAAMDFLEAKFGKDSEMLAVFDIIDDNGIPF